MYFKVFGPFPIELDDYGNVPNSVSSFWQLVDETQEGLSRARGCYVFGIRSSGGTRIYPWYVGRTNMQAFEAECFKPHQRNHYSRAINYYERARPFLYFVAEMTKGGRFCRGGGRKSVAFLETYLIGFGLRVNKNLLNKRDTKLYRAVVFPGFLNSNKGNPGNGAKELQKTLKFRIAGGNGPG